MDDRRNKLEKFAKRLDAPTRLRLRAMFEDARKETDPISRQIKGEAIVSEIRKAMANGKVFKN
jgi:hypothetical protein